MSGKQPGGDVSSDQLLVMGQVSAPYGIKGWLHVTPYTDQPDGLLDYPRWQLHMPAGGWQEIAVVQGRLHGKGLVVQLAGCADRDAASRYSGAEIAIRRSELPAAGADEYYWSDLTGLDVITLSGRRLGKVDHLIETGSNDVLVVQGEQECLVPFIKDQVIKTVDLAAGIIRVDWDPDY